MCWNIGFWFLHLIWISSVIIVIYLVWIKKKKKKLNMVDDFCAISNTHRNRLDSRSSSFFFFPSTWFKPEPYGCELQQWTPSNCEMGFYHQITLLSSANHPATWILVCEFDFVLVVEGSSWVCNALCLNMIIFKRICLQFMLGFDPIQPICMIIWCNNHPILLIEIKFFHPFE